MHLLAIESKRTCSVSGNHHPDPANTADVHCKVDGLSSIGPLYHRELERTGIWKDPRDHQQRAVGTRTKAKQKPFIIILSINSMLYECVCISVYIGSCYACKLWAVPNFST